MTKPETNCIRTMKKNCVYRWREFTRSVLYFPFSPITSVSHIDYFLIHCSTTLDGRTMETRLAVPPVLIMMDGYGFFSHQLYSFFYIAYSSYPEDMLRYYERRFCTVYMFLSLCHGLDVLFSVRLVCLSYGLQQSVFFKRLS